MLSGLGFACQIFCKGFTEEEVLINKNLPDGVLCYDEGDVQSYCQDGICMPLVKKQNRKSEKKVVILLLLNEVLFL